MDKKLYTWTDDEFFSLIRAAYEKEELSGSWTTEANAIRSALKAFAKALPSSRYAPVSVLGVGGSGIVLRIADSLFPNADNALKFPRPVPGKVDRVAEMLEKEMRFLANLRHPGIVRLLYHKTLPSVSGYSQLPFYLMEAIDGSGSSKFMRSSTTTQQMFLIVARHFAEVLRYLHQDSGELFVHLDIKPDNVVITRDGRPIMIDLGTCKRTREDETMTVVACTKSMAHPALVRMLDQDPSDNNRAQGTLKRSAIEPAWDLWAFGRTMLMWLGVQYDNGELESNALIHRVDPYTRKYLLLLCGRLLSYHLPNWLADRLGLSENMLKGFPVSSASQLCNLIDRLVVNVGPVSELAELDECTTGTIQASPGLHVASTPRLVKTIDHRLFRRLGSITQLGVVSQVFPSAKHSRREHSLGTYGNVCRLVRTLYHDHTSPLFKQIIESSDIREVLLCALLHDVGHFPLAHELEEIDPLVFSHDRLTEGMLKGVWRTGKLGSREIPFDSLAEVFTAWGTTSDRILSILDAKSTSTAHFKDKLLRSMISGPIDADKLDYLFRDARHTDVPYPHGIDVDRLHRCLTTVVLAKFGTAENVPALGVYSKGRVAAEFMTLARYAMFAQVYWHHTVRAHKAMLNRAVTALLVGQPNGERGLEEFRTAFVEIITAIPEIMFGHGSSSELFPHPDKDDALGAFLSRGTDLVATDAFLVAWLRHRLALLSRPETGLLDRLLVRDLYKRLWVMSRDSTTSGRWDELVQAWGNLDRARRHKVALEFEERIFKRLQTDGGQSLTTMSSTEGIKAIEQLTTGKTPWLVIDVPAGRPGSEVPLHYVVESQGRRMRKDDHVVGNLQPSPVWRDYARNLQQVAGRIRVYCDPRFADFVDASISQDVGFEILGQVLESAA